MKIHMMIIGGKCWRMFGWEIQYCYFHHFWNLKAIFNQTWKWIHSEKAFKGWCKIQPSKWTKNKFWNFCFFFFLVFNLWYMIPPWILFFIQDETTTRKTCVHTDSRDTLFTFKSLRLLALHLKACKIYQAQLCTIFSFSIFY